MNLITLFLTCADRPEAEKIADSLLDKRLAACVRLTDVYSAYWWEGKKERADEVLLMIESSEDKFNSIENLVRQLHSYEAFVLEAVRVAHASKGVEEWVKESLNVAG
jgi:periplasmic divalent cation tolerance protein